MAHTKAPTERKMVNLSPYAASLLENRKAMMDKQRKKLGKPDIKIGQILEAALENLTIEMGVNK
jgi:hypothetical protein